MKTIRTVALAAALCPMLVLGDNATYYNHYTNANAGLALSLQPNQALSGITASVDMQMQALGYIVARNGGWVNTAMPVVCSIDGQVLLQTNLPWSPMNQSLTARIPLPVLSPGAHTVKVEHTNTLEYYSETQFSYSYSHKIFLSTYYHYYYDVIHYRTRPCSVSQTLTVIAPTNYHKIQLTPRTSSPTLTTALDDAFNGAAGSPPNPATFAFSGEVTLDGSGAVALQTWNSSESWLKSAASLPASSNFRLDFRAYAYAEGDYIYGDGQPRGLRVGIDQNNTVEFYSASGRSIGIRTRKNGVEASASFPLPAGVDTYHDYAIEVRPDSATFILNGTVLGTLSNNVPSGWLNFFMSTFDGYAGNVPSAAEFVSMTHISQGSNYLELIYTGAPLNTYSLYTSSDLSEWTLHSSTNSSSNGTATWTDNIQPGQRFYKVFGP